MNNKLAGFLSALLVIPAVTIAALAQMPTSAPPTSGSNSGGSHGSSSGHGGIIVESNQSSGPNNNGGEYIGDKGSSGAKGSSIAATTSAPEWAERARTAAEADGMGGVVKVQGASEVSLNELQQMATAAEAAGGAVILCADHMEDGAVSVRLTIDPAQSTRDINLQASSSSELAQRTLQRFESHYANKLSVVSLGHSGSFGQKVQVAAKLDLTGFDSSDLALYTYSREDNSFQRIPDPGFRVDGNGYLHFCTDQGGDIIVSGGALVKR